MQELSLREIQLIELDVLKTIDKICRKNDLTYFLAAGTLIGAIRHKGFIPWDDDVDIMMPRNDYEKLISLYKKNVEIFDGMVLKHYTTDKRYIYPIARLCNCNYTIEYKNATDYGLGPFVDIYPYDGCGNSLEGAKRAYKKLSFIRDAIVLAGNNHYLSSTKSRWRNIIKYPFFLFSKVVGVNKLIKTIDNKAKKGEYNSSDYVYCLVWGDSVNRIIPKTYLSQKIEVQFENYNFWAPKGYEQYLKNIYGNYMELPPESERIAHHYYKVYKK